MANASPNCVVHFTDYDTVRDRRPRSDREPLVLVIFCRIENIDQPPITYGIEVTDCCQEYLSLSAFCECVVSTDENCNMDFHVQRKHASLPTVVELENFLFNATGLMGRCLSSAQLKHKVLKVHIIRRI